MNKLILSASIALICAGGAHAATLTKSAAAPSAPVPSVACPSGPGFLTYNTDCTPVAGSIACGATGLVTTAENSYYRRYVLDPNSAPNVQISTVRLAIETATGAGIAGILARVYTIPDGSPLTVANLTLIGSAPIPATAGQTLAELTVTISPAAVVDTPATKNIVVELFQPDLAPASSAVLFGSNSTGTGVTFIRAPSCGITAPTDIATLNAGAFANVRIIASLAGAGLPVELQDYKVE